HGSRSPVLLGDSVRDRRRGRAHAAQRDHHLHVRRAHAQRRESVVHWIFAALWSGRAGVRDFRHERRRRRSSRRVSHHHRNLPPPRDGGPQEHQSAQRVIQVPLAQPGGVHPLAGSVAELVWLLPVLPLIGFVINGAISLLSAFHVGPADPSAAHGGHDATSHAAGPDAHGRHDDHAAPARGALHAVVTIVGPLVLVLAFVLGVAIFMAMPSHMATPFVKTYFAWMPVGTDLPLRWAFQVDQLSVMMVLFVTGVSALIHIFSVGYMGDDPGYARYFSFLNLFVAFMLVLVLGASFPVMFVGWEGVGLVSYLLIGFWFNDKANADAGKKASIVNRIGDFGFLIAMFLIWSNVGTLDFSGVAAGVGALPA